MNQDMLKEIEFPSGPMGGCIQYFIFAIHKYYMDYTWFFNHFSKLIYVRFTHNIPRISTYFIKFLHDNNDGKVLLLEYVIYVEMYG